MSVKICMQQMYPKNADVPNRVFSIAKEKCERFARTQIRKKKRIKCMLCILTFRILLVS